MANQLFASIEWRVDDSELDTTEKKLTSIEDSLKEINDPNALASINREFEELNHVIDTSSLTFSEMGKAVEQYQSIALKAGVESPVGQQALNNAAELKDRMDNVTVSVDMLSRKGVALQAALEIGTGITAGYGAFIGLTQLAGSESEKFEKALTKLMAVQTTLSSIEQIQLSLRNKSILSLQLKNFWTDAQTMSTTLLSGAMKKLNVSTKAATIATKGLAGVFAASGIGLLVVGVNALINKFMKGAKQAEEYTEHQKELEEQIQATADAIDRQSESLNQSVLALEFATRRQIIAAKEMGKTQFQLDQIMIDSLKLKLKLYQADLVESKKVLNTFGEINKMAAQMAGQPGAPTPIDAEQIQMASDNVNDLRNSITDLELTIEMAEVDLKLRREGQAASDAAKAFADAQKNKIITYDTWLGFWLSGMSQYIQTIWDVDAEAENAFQRQVERDRKAFESRKMLYGQLEGLDKDMIESASTAIDDVMEDQDAQLSLRLEMTSAAFKVLESAIIGFGEVTGADAKKQFRIAKAFNLAQAVINTAGAVISQINTPNLLDVASGANFKKAAVAAAIGGAQIIKIATTQFRESGSSGSDTGAVQSIISNLSGVSGNNIEGADITTDLGDVTGSDQTPMGQPVLVVDSFTKVFERQRKIESLGSI